MYFLSKYVKTYKNEPQRRRRTPKTRKASQNNKNVPTAEEEGPQKQQKPIKVIEELVVHRVAERAGSLYIYMLAGCCAAHHSRGMCERFRKGVYLII